MLCANEELQLTFRQDWPKMNPLVNSYCPLVDQNLQLGLGKVSCSVVICLAASAGWSLCGTTQCRVSPREKVFFFFPALLLLPILR